jgi:outer membrane protein TolC
LSLQAGQKAQKAYVQALEQLHNDIALELELGKRARIELIKAEADLKNSRAAFARIGADINILKAALANLLNIESIPDLEEILISAETIQPVQPITKPEVYSLERLKAAKLEVEKNKKQILKVKSILYPQLVFNTSYLQNFGPNDDGHKNSGEWENQEVWQAGINLKWNIFDFGLSRAKIQKAKIMEQQSRYEQTKIKQELKRSLVEAVTKINTAASDYDSAREEYKLTMQTESIEQVRFEQGAADINDLLYAKARNQFALSRFIKVGYAYISGIFYLDYLLEQGQAESAD